MSAREALARVEQVTGAWEAQLGICRRAHAGLIQARAARLIIRGREREPDETRADTEIPPEFWWAEGEKALEQNWNTGDFSTWIGMESRKRRWQAFGVLFDRETIEAMVPNPVAALPRSGALELTATSTRGPRRSEAWIEWTAELALYVNEKGIPGGEGSQGQEEMINAIADRLAKRGIECLGRTTVQKTVQAVIDRLRSANN